jgi:hypothetical protein
MICPLLVTAVVLAGYKPLTVALDMAKAECRGADCAWWSDGRCTMAWIGQSCSYFFEPGVLLK